MTSYTVLWTPTAERQLRGLDTGIQRRIQAKVAALAQNPLRHLTRLVNSPFYRLRVGDFRVIVAVEARTVTVVILQVVHRRTAYR